MTRSSDKYITLLGFGPFLGAPDSSPFVIKVMVLLKLAGLDYLMARGNPLRAPKKLLPYIVDDGATVADSTFIRQHIEHKYGVDFDAGLSATQRGQAWTVERMCEDHLYFAMLESRWMHQANFKKGVGTMFGVVSPPLRPLARVMLRRMNAARLYGHGIGRHTNDQIALLAEKDIEVLAALLGDKPFIMGEKPCGADATVLGFVNSILTPPLESTLRTSMGRRANLVSYCDRLTRQFFSASRNGGIDSKDRVVAKTKED
jgi:glutathione S-transferase